MIVIIVMIGVVDGEKVTAVIQPSVLMIFSPVAFIVVQLCPYDGNTRKLREYQQRQDCSKPKPKHNHNGHALEEHIQQQRGEAEYGRKGGEEDGTQARRGGVNDRTVLILLRCCSISSTSTMPLRISIPLRLSRPINAIKPKGMPEIKTPASRRSAPAARSAR